MIQRGLHCLNGRDGEDETTAREKYLLGLSINDFQFGLALHAYGDSFAHRDPEGKMFHGWQGHLHGKPDEEVTHSDSWWDDFTGCAVDHIHRRPTTFKKYAAGLYDLLCKVTPDMRRQKSAEEVQACIKALTPLSREEDQIRTLRSHIKQIVGTVNFYPPEMFEPLSWEAYKTSGRAIDDVAQRLKLSDLYGFARQWDRGDAPGMR